MAQSYADLWQQKTKTHISSSQMVLQVRYIEYIKYQDITIHLKSIWLPSKHGTITIKTQCKAYYPSSPFPPSSSSSSSLQYVEQND